jgi:hypothetical protein
MNQTGRDVQEYNTDEHAESYKTLLPHTPPGTTMWRQLRTASNTRINQFTDDKNGERQNMVPHINKDLTPECVVFWNSYYTVGGGHLDTEIGPSPPPDITES